MSKDRHDCPGRCGRTVHRHMLACRHCWRQLPPELRTAVQDAHAAKRRNRADVTAAIVHRHAVAAALAWYREQATYWNGERTPARRVRLRLAPAADTPHPQYWATHLAGQIRAAVRVEYAGKVFYLDDEDGSGWAKVTDGHGLPRWPSRSLYGMEVP